jgi:hypothetical protein
MPDPHTATPLNGAKLTWWIIGTVTTLVVGLSSGALSSLRNHTERIAVLESQLSDTRHQLQRIEHKVDQLLDQWRKR